MSLTHFNFEDYINPKKIHTTFKKALTNTYSGDGKSYPSTSLGKHVNGEMAVFYTPSTSPQ